MERFLERLLFDAGMMRTRLVLGYEQKTATRSLHLSVVPCRMQGAFEGDLVGAHCFCAALDDKATTQINKHTTKVARTRHTRKGIRITFRHDWISSGRWMQGYPFYAWLVMVSRGHWGLREGHTGRDGGECN